MSGVPSVTGFGVAVFTIAISALLALPTTTVANAEFVVRLGTMLTGCRVGLGDGGPRGCGRIHL